MSADITLNLTATFAAHDSPRTGFGTYDADAQFITDADGMVRLVHRRLGGDQVQIELTNRQVYICLEDAMFEFSAITNAYQTKSTLVHLLGYPTGSLSGSQNQIPRFDLALAKRKAEGYSSEALVGGTKPLYSGSITTVIGQQHYDLNYMLSASGLVQPGTRAEIRKIFHFSPTAAYRFFDTTSAMNFMNNELGFESFTPETIFYMLPVWEDVLRGSQMELNQNVRRSNYSYAIINNVVSIYPVPTTEATIFFSYFLVGSTGSAGALDPNDPFINGVSNLSNIPYGNLEYSKINSIGKQWVKKMALAFAKQTLGHARRKVAEIPIPNGNMVLDGPALVQEAISEQENLRQELKLWLDDLTYVKLMQTQMEESDALQRILAKVPNGIFVG